MIRRLSKPTQQAMKVLFCGHNFSGGFLYSKEAIEKRLAARKEDIANIQVIECSREDVEQHITTASVVVPWMSKITSSLMNTAPQLRLIMQFGVGLEGVEIPAASERGIFVARIDSEACGNAQSCAEHCIYLATASLRNVNELKKSIQNGKLGWPVGRTLFAARTMIIGFGGIGRQLLPRLLAMGAAEITIVCRRIPSDHEEFLHDPRVQFVEYNNIFGKQTYENESKLNIDALFLCCTVNAENIGMVNTKFLDCFLPGLHIVNVSRVSILSICASISLCH
jgi:phosphoglycerate dehydrogenase-like enzyme